MNTTKKLMTLLLALLAMTQAAAQEYEYVPFVREGVKWVYSYDNPFFSDMPDGHHYFAFEMRGDTLYEGKHYKSVRLYYVNYNGEEIHQDITPVWLREENKVVYGIHLDGYIHPQCPVGYGSYISGTTLISVPKEEFVLYDFNDPEAVYQDMWSWEVNNYLSTDTIKIGTQYRKRHHYNAFYGDENVIIEGIGCDGYGSMPLFYFPTFITGLQVDYNLSHVIENGEIIYKGDDYTEDMYMPIIRDGVKWVYEKVTVQDGDTTCYYYNYQFGGLYPGLETYAPFNYACYYSIGNGHRNLSAATDSLIAGVSDHDGYVGCIKNYALESSIMKGATMLNYHEPPLNTQTLYSSLRLNDDDLYWFKYYLHQDQQEDFFNDDNLVLADPIIIENCICSRLAYIGEDGDTLAYIVEGIGFDSRDMGDLLTPFTRQPDPTADYQEWCGLSHVVKDGKIIYKGMRYREGAFDGDDDTDGDVNGDGDVNISDANNVIEIIINGGNGHDRINEHSQIIGDVNHDGVVNITDLNLIINTIINH